MSGSDPAIPEEDDRPPAHLVPMTSAQVTGIARILLDSHLDLRRHISRENAIDLLAKLTEIMKEEI